MKSKRSASIIRRTALLCVGVMVHSATGSAQVVTEERESRLSKNRRVKRYMPITCRVKRYDNTHDALEAILR